MGKFELAHGGTLFLDEVGEMPLGMQPKILRVLQEREIERVGGIKPVAIDIRIVAATNKDLGEVAKAGRFREDLFFRLNVVNIHLPPLREHREDIPALSRFFLKQYAEKFNRRLSQLGDQAQAWLLRQRWPGNVRELENVIQRAVVLTEGDVLDLDDLQEAVHAYGDAVPEEVGTGRLRERLATVNSNVEKKLIVQALAEEADRRGAAALRLGISRKNLYNKMKKYGLV